MKKFLVETTAWNENKYQGYRLTTKRVVEADSEAQATAESERLMNKHLGAMCAGGAFPGMDERIKRQSKVTPL